MKRLVNFRPVVILASVYACGILSLYLALKFHITVAILLLIIPVVTAVAVALFTKFKAKGKIIFCFICFAVALSGFFNVYLRYNDFYVEGGEEEVVVKARVCAVYSNGYDFDNGAFLYSGREYTGEKFFVYGAPGLFDVGDVITFEAKAAPAPKYSGGDIEFSYFVYGNRFRISSDFQDCVYHENRLTVFEKPRLKITKALYGNMNADRASLIAAMLFGDDDKLDTYLLEQSRYAGIGHLFAVSGLHVGFISFLIYFILKLFKLPAPFACVFSVLATFFYTGMCSFSPSSLRAFIMYAFYIIFATVGIKNDAMNSTATSAAILLLIRPQYLFSYSFLLSYAAAFAIVVLNVPFCRLFSFMPKTVAESFAVLFSVQLGIFPASIAFFSYTSPLSFPLNFFLLPLITPIFSIFIICTVFTLVTGLGKIGMFLPNLFSGLLIKLVTAADFSAAVINGRTTAVLVCVYYAGLLLASDLFNINYRAKMGIFTVCFMVFVLFSQLFLAGML